MKKTTRDGWSPLYVFIRPETKRWLEERAKSEDTNVSLLVRQIISHAIKQEEKNERKKI